MDLYLSLKVLRERDSFTVEVLLRFGAWKGNGEEVRDFYIKYKFSRLYCGVQGGDRFWSITIWDTVEHEACYGGMVPLELSGC